MEAGRREATRAQQAGQYHREIVSAARALRLKEEKDRQTRMAIQGKQLEQRAADERRMALEEENARLREEVDVRSKDQWNYTHDQWHAAYKARRANKTAEEFKKRDAWEKEQ